MGRLLILVVSLVALHQCAGANYDTDDILNRFREYLRINTTTYNDLTPAVEFWKRLAESEDLPINVYNYTEGFPVVVIKWAGTDPSAPSIMLNSHMDVVPADIDDGWTYPPFEAVLDEDGNIYGRGTQDMKSVSMQYFEALRRIKANGITMGRDVYMTLMPDEEVGARDGMIPFLASEQFAELDVGFEMDEGSSFPLPMVAMFYQDKVAWQIQVDCRAASGHGSTFAALNSTAVGKCYNVMQNMFALRGEQYEISQKATIENAGIYTSINLNKLNGGTANNVLANHVSLLFDIRLSTTVNTYDFAEQIDNIMADASSDGDDVELTYIQKDQQSPATLVTAVNPYYTAIIEAASQVNLTILPVVPPGSTDARFVRNSGIPAFGFSPMPNTPMLLHSVDEYINKDVFLRGIDIYYQIIQNLANIPAEDTDCDPSVYLFKTNE